MEITEVSKCRLCQGELYDILDLGDMYPSSFYSESHNLSKAPVVLSRCKSCSLVQLRYSVSLDMYSQYWYRSGLNRSMKRDLLDVVDYIGREYGLSAGSRFLDIGCNDGTMLSCVEPSVYRVGVDPSKNVGIESKAHCNRFINDYFSPEYFVNERFDVITSIAMFYDIEDPLEFVKQVKSIMAHDGVWIIQMTDLHSMLRVNAFDNVCSEHVTYWSLRPLDFLFEKCGMEIIDINYNRVNGGSIRIAVANTGARQINRAVDKLRHAEKVGAVDISRFKGAIEYSRRGTWDFLLKGGVYGYGASTKGNTLLQYFKITSTELVAIAEVNEDKFGLRTVGSDIPIVSEEDMFNSEVGLIMVLPWHFEDDILPRYPNWKGEWFFPLPSPHIAFSSKNAISDILHVMGASS